jgi:transcriptional regulator with XRE-family HTH domain
LADLGDRLRLARLRRRLSGVHVAERAGMTVKTLAAVERGNAGVTMGAYLAVLQTLQLEESLAQVGADDPLGRALQDRTASPKRARRLAPRANQARAPKGAHAQSPQTGHAAESIPAPKVPPSHEEGGVSTDTLLEILRKNDPPK